MPDPATPWHQRSRLRIKHLVLLAELGETGNVRRAAGRLNMTQPAASKLLMEAEEAFGRQLFERSRRGIAPNDAGIIAIRKAKFLLQELEGARDEIALATEDPAGRVMVGAYAVAVSLLLPMTVLRLKAAYPRILLTVDEGTNSGLLPALERGALDCVVGRLPEDLPPGLAAQILYDEPVVVVCGPHHPLAAAAPTLADLAIEDWILPPLDHPFRKKLEAMFSVAGLRAPNVILESASSMMNASTVPNSRALAMMPVGTARFLETRQSLRILPFSLGSAHPPVAVLLRKGTEPGVALAKFLEALHVTAGQLNAPYLSEVSAL